MCACADPFLRVSVSVPTLQTIPQQAGFSGIRHSVLPEIMFVTFGEAMLRLSPVNEGPAMYGRGNPSARAAFMRAVGGDELNVSVRVPPSLPSHDFT